MRYKNITYKAETEVLNAFQISDVFKNSRDIYVDKKTGQIINATEGHSEFRNTNSGAPVNSVRTMTTDGNLTFIMALDDSDNVVVYKSTDLGSFSIVKTFADGDSEISFACTVKGVILFWYYDGVEGEVVLSYSDDDGANFTTTDWGADSFYAPIKVVFAYGKVFYLERHYSARILESDDGITPTVFLDDNDWQDLEECGGFLFGVAETSAGTNQLYRIYEDGTKDLIKSYSAKISISSLDTERLVIASSIENYDSLRNGSFSIDVYDFKTDGIRNIFTIDDKDYTGVKAFPVVGGDLYIAGRITSDEGHSSHSELFIVNTNEIVYHHHSFDDGVDINHIDSFQNSYVLVELTEQSEDPVELRIRSFPVDRLATNDTEEFFMQTATLYFPIFIPKDTIIPKQIILKHDPLLEEGSSEEGASIKVFVLEDSPDVDDFSATPVMISDTFGSVRKTYDFPNGKSLNMIWIKLELWADTNDMYVIPTGVQLSLVYQEAGLLNAN